MNRLLRVIVLVVGVSVLPGCARSIYEWGSYEGSIYDLYTDEFNLQRNIDILTREVEKTRDTGGVIPPGKLAHLGYLHSLAGNVDAAVQSFEAEKAAFPESAKFVDFLITRVRATRAGGAGQP